MISITLVIICRLCLYISYKVFCFVLNIIWLVNHCTKYMHGLINMICRITHMQKIEFDMNYQLTKTFHTYLFKIRLRIFKFIEIVSFPCTTSIFVTQHFPKIYLPFANTTKAKKKNQAKEYMITLKKEQAKWRIQELRNKLFKNLTSDVHSKQ